LKSKHYEQHANDALMGLFVACMQTEGNVCCPAVFLINQTQLKNNLSFMNQTITNIQFVKRLFVFCLVWAAANGIATKAVAQANVPCVIITHEQTSVTSETVPTSNSNYSQKLWQGLQNGAYLITGMLLALIGFTQMFKGKQTFPKIPLRLALLITLLCLSVFAAVSLSGCGVASKASYGKKYHQAIKQQRKRGCPTYKK
jgi:hypothetical protein